jgi:hypothetical protein
MKTKNSNQRTHQIGEQLVVSKLGKLGILATPSAGNVPDCHLLASDRSGHSLPLRVMAINRGSWQFDAKKFLEIDLPGCLASDGKKSEWQVVKGEKKLSNPDLVCIFILLKRDERGEFYIFPLRTLQQHCNKTYHSKGDSKGDSFPREVRRQKREATHCAVRLADMKEWDYKVKEGDWSLITKHFHPVTGMGEPTAAPNGGPAAPLVNWGVAEGPPSMS